MLKALIFESEKDNFNYAWELFTNQKFTKLSFVDCSIISISKNRDIPFVATFDQEFKKMGNIKVIDN